MNQISTDQQLQDDGFYVVPTGLSQEQADQLLAEIEGSIETDSSASIRSSRGTVYAARNLIDSLDLMPLIRSTELADHLTAAIGEDCGLVRVLYFDKPSDRSWSLPYHKDLTIAVEDNSLATEVFCKPTRKSGVDHVEASEAVLENMVTLRIHLDTVTEANGPLQVIPASHLSGKNIVSYEKENVKILVQRGDVLVMRPMLVHASGHTAPEKQLHRRILHLEFSGTSQLPDGFAWKHFLPL